MSLFVQTNVASMVSQDNFATNELKLNQTMEQLSSGYKINSAADDAAGLGIASRLSAQVASFTSATQIGNILTRLRQLAVEGANGTMSPSDSANLNTEFQAQLNEIDQIANTTIYNGQNVLAGAATTDNFQVGINTTASDTMS